MGKKEERWWVGTETLALLFLNHGVLVAKISLPMPPINPKFQLFLKGALLLPLVVVVMPLPLISITVKMMLKDLPMLGFWLEFVLICAQVFTVSTEKERIQREKLRDLAVFERLNGNPGKSSPALAVKKFCRTISSKYVQASEMRPLTVLENTLNYLMSLLDSKEHPFEVVHDIIFDRTRSIRQDLTMQNIVDKKAICMYEGMVKFHVISNHKLWCCMGDPNIASMHHLNMEQLTKTLASLFNLYEANRNTNEVHENEAEFHSLYVLLHLGSHSKPTGEPLSFWLSHVSAPVLKSKEMRFARRIVRSFRLGNYMDFFHCAAVQASYLQYCVMEPYINEVRALALSCINFGGYKLHPYPLFDLSKHLRIEESDLESFCHSCGLETCTDESGNKLLPTKQTTFNHPKVGFQKYSFLGLQDYENQF